MLFNFAPLIGLLHSCTICHEQYSAVSLWCVLCFPVSQDFVFLVQIRFNHSISYRGNPDYTLTISVFCLLIDQIECLTSSCSLLLRNCLIILFEQMLIVVKLLLLTIEMLTYLKILV